MIVKKDILKSEKKWVKFPGLIDKGSI